MDSKHNAYLFLFSKLDFFSFAERAALEFPVQAPEDGKSGLKKEADSMNLDTLLFLFNFLFFSFLLLLLLFFQSQAL